MHVRKALAGKIHSEYVIAEQGARDILTHFFSETVVLKWVKLFLILDWISKRFPDIQVIQIIRHPVPMSLSWRARGWDPGSALGRMLGQDCLIGGRLRPFSTLMREAETFWEKVGAFWGATTFLQMCFHRPGWILLEHEWYCVDAQERFRWLIQQAGLSWADEIARFLESRGRSTPGPGYGHARDPKTEIHKWERNISIRELDELETVLKKFNLPFYKGLDPEAFWQPEGV